MQYYSFDMHLHCFVLRISSKNQVHRRKRTNGWEIYCWPCCVVIHTAQWILCPFTWRIIIFPLSCFGYQGIHTHGYWAWEFLSYGLGRFLKFLLATFKYEQEHDHVGRYIWKFSVHGFIQIFYRGLNGTISRYSIYGGIAFDDKAAHTICSQAGYASTHNGWNRGEYCRTSKEIDRSSLRCLISGLRCSGRDGERLSQCGMDPIEDSRKRISPNSSADSDGLRSWDHGYDVAIKCDF